MLLTRLRVETCVCEVCSLTPDRLSVARCFVIRRCWQCVSKDFLFRADVLILCRAQSFFAKILLIKKKKKRFYFFSFARYTALFYALSCTLHDAKRTVNENDRWPTLIVYQPPHFHNRCRDIKEGEVCTRGSSSISILLSAVQPL